MRRSTKALPEISSDKIEESKRWQYLVNSQAHTAIKLLPCVQEVFRKMASSEERAGLSADIFAMALAFRRARDVTKSLQDWNSMQGRSSYPADKVTCAFSKFLHSTLLSPLLDKFFLEDEVTCLVDFFAKCPHGYEFPDRLVWAHSELLPLLT